MFAGESKPFSSEFSVKDLTLSKGSLFHLEIRNLIYLPKENEKSKSVPSSAISLIIGPEDSHLKSCSTVIIPMLNPIIDNDVEINTKTK